MYYNKTITLKNGKKCILRNGLESDGQAVFENFNLTHEETDYMLTYPDENSMDSLQEGIFLKEKAQSPDEVEILAIVDDVIAGTAGIAPIGRKYKIRHRAEFGLGIAKEYWGLGIGRALLEACIECAKQAGYEQLELDVVAENERAVAMYENAGFTVYGSNPKGFKSRYTGDQELLYMRLEL